MHCFRDAPSLHQFLKSCSPELHQLINAQLAALAAFDDVPLGELAHFFILEPEDPVGDLELAMGRSLGDISIEYCASHSDWFELVIVVSDDGFGYVVFIPKTIEDESLLEFCLSQSTRIQEDGS